ncbi:MAG: CDP-glycerol glycerophosphotransferase family protein [Planctomycetota bacterium]
MVKNTKQKRWRGMTQGFRGHRTVLFSAGSPMNVDVMRPLLDVLAADERIDLCFAGEYREPGDVEALAEASGLDGVTLLTEKEAKSLKADMYLCPDGSRYGKNCHCRVLLFHGVSFKGRAIARRARWFHQIFLVGPYQRRQFVERGIFEKHDPRLVSVGMPKLDRLVRSTIDRDQVRARLGVGNDEACVLYAPTWSEQSSLFTLGEELIDALSAEPGVRLVVKFHDHHLNPSRSSIDWRERAARWNPERVALFEETDVVPALAAADVLVTDASSVSQEFCLLDRPILFAEVKELYESERYRETADLKTWGQSAGPVFKTPEQAVKELRRSLANPTEFSPIRRKLAQDMFYHPGHATKRALEVLYRELRL